MEKTHRVSDDYYGNGIDEGRKVIIQFSPKNNLFFMHQENRERYWIGKPLITKIKDDDDDLDDVDIDNNIQMDYDLLND